MVASTHQASNDSWEPQVAQDMPPLLCEHDNLARSVRVAHSKAWVGNNMLCKTEAWQVVLSLLERKWCLDQ